MTSPVLGSSGPDLAQLALSHRLVGSGVAGPQLGCCVVPSTASLPYGCYRLRSSARSVGVRWVAGIFDVSCWTAVLLGSVVGVRWSLVSVKVAISMVEDVVLSTAAKVVVKLAWCASLAAAMVVGASGAVSSCEACIWCSLHRRWSSGAPNLLVVGRSVPHWVRHEAMLSTLPLSYPSSGASM
jgi:hypothetical protein